MRIFLILLISLFSINGCIRHSDQPIKRKVRKENIEQNKNDSVNRLNILLMVNDIKQTINFYNEILNFQLVAVDSNNSGDYNFAIINNDHYEIMLQEKINMISQYPYLKYKDIGGTSVLYFHVDNLMEIHSKAANNAQIINELHQTFHGTKEFAILDNNGYVLNFSELLK